MTHCSIVSRLQQVAKPRHSSESIMTVQYYLTYNKNNFRFEEYLHVICNVKHRQAITKLRISAHKLPVESGRYNKTPYNERKCTLCQSDEIGDEFHYLMSCPNNEFVKLRNTFVTDICKINSSFRSIDTKNLFLYILNVHDKSIMKIISIYFHDTLAMYDSLL